MVASIVMDQTVDTSEAAPDGTAFLLLVSPRFVEVGGPAKGWFLQANSSARRFSDMMTSQRCDKSCFPHALRIERVNAFGITALRGETRLTVRFPHINFARLGPGDRTSDSNI